MASFNDNSLDALDTQIPETQSGRRIKIAWSQPYARQCLAKGLVLIRPLLDEFDHLLAVPSDWILKTPRGREIERASSRSAMHQFLDHCPCKGWSLLDEVGECIVGPEQSLAARLRVPYPRGN